MLARDFGVPFFSAGELIRSLIASGCPEGKQLQDIILQGHIIPSEVRQARGGRRAERWGTRSWGQLIPRGLGHEIVGRTMVKYPLAGRVGHGRGYLKEPTQRRGGRMGCAHVTASKPSPRPATHRLPAFPAGDCGPAAEGHGHHHLGHGAH